jgi:hypothetical protein
MSAPPPTEWKESRGSSWAFLGSFEEPHLPWNACRAREERACAQSTLFVRTFLPFVENEFLSCLFGHGFARSAARSNCTRAGPALHSHLDLRLDCCQDSGLSLRFKTQSQTHPTVIHWQYSVAASPCFPSFLRTYYRSGSLFRPRKRAN